MDDVHPSRHHTNRIEVLYDMRCIYHSVPKVPRRYNSSTKLDSPASFFHGHRLFTHYLKLAVKVT
jgi:hypothetical protein